MPELTHSPRGRRWADILAIITAVTLVGVSLWPSIMSTSDDGTRDTTRPGTLVLVRIAVAAATVAAVALAQNWRRRSGARGLLVAGAVALVVSLVLFRDLGTWELWSMLLPAVALLAAATAIGPLPERD
jgi:hypothetical protein